MLTALSSCSRGAPLLSPVKARELDGRSRQHLLILHQLEHFACLVCQSNCLLSTILHELNADEREERSCWLGADGPAPYQQLPDTYQQLPSLAPLHQFECGGQHLFGFVKAASIGELCANEQGEARVQRIIELREPLFRCLCFCGLTNGLVDCLLILHHSCLGVFHFYH
jgi:hypothetical protein